MLSASPPVYVSTGTESDLDGGIVESRSPSDDTRRPDTDGGSASQSLHAVCSITLQRHRKPPVLAPSQALRGSNGDAVTTKAAWVYSVSEDGFVLEDISF
jgi:hypothetical protein